MVLSLNSGRNKITGVIGCKGSGKSHWCRNEFAEAKRAIVFDTLHEHRFGLCTSSRVEVGKFILRFQAFRVSFTPGSGENLISDFNWICNLCYAAKNMLFLIEEVDYFCAANFSQPGLDKLIRYGRHAGVNLTYTARRMAEISRSLTSQTDRFVIFRISEPNDLEHIERRFGFEFCEKVKALRNHDFLIFDVQEGWNESQKDSGSGRVQLSAGVRDRTNHVASDSAVSDSVDEAANNSAVS